MNIFEALEKGGGRATLLGVCASRFVSKRLVWIGEIAGFKHGWDGISDEDLKRNDWIPYVPRGTCSTCGFPSYLGRTIKLTSDFKCGECGRSFEFTTPPKVKHKEVFKNIKWWTFEKYGFTYLGSNQLTNKPPMTMTLEWEE